MDLIYWLIAVVTVLVGLYVIGTRPYGHFKKRGIPFVRPVPFLGSSAPLMMRTKSMPDYINDIYKEFKDESPLVGYYEFLKPLVMVCDPEMIKLITVKDSEYFQDHRPTITEDLDPYIGKNLFALQGQRWKNMRSTLSPAFTSSKMKAMFVFVSKCGEQMAEHIAKRTKAENVEVLSVELKDFFTRYTNDVIATSAFGIHCDSMENPDNEFYQMGKVTSTIGVSRIMVFLGFMAVPKLMKLLNFTLLPKKVCTFFTDLIHNTLEVREREGIIRPDMIHLLMQAQKGTLHNEVNTGEDVPRTIEITEEDIAAQALIFFLAGFDTISTLLCFTTQLLAIHEDVQERLRKEIDDTMEEDGGKLTYEGMQRMVYLDMVINESLRLFPPAPITDRACIKPYKMAATDKSPSFNINKGDGIWIPVFALQRDPQYFEDPEKFDPERFSNVNKHKIHPFTYLPFGTGPRNCIGMRFALMEAKIAIVSLLAKFHFDVVEKTSVPMKLDRKSFTMTIEGGFWVGLRAKE